MMTVHDQLDALRGSFDGCRLIAFIDLQSELVLSCSAVAKPPQEVLDALAVRARTALPTAGDSVSARFADDAPPDEAFVSTPDQTTIYLRSLNEEAEALCCVCEPLQDIGSFRDSARTALNQITAEE